MVSSSENFLLPLFIIISNWNLRSFKLSHHINFLNITDLISFFLPPFCNVTLSLHKSTQECNLAFVQKRENPTTKKNNKCFKINSFPIYLTIVGDKAGIPRTICEGSSAVTQKFND